jgi:hypothetical protein
MTRHITVGHRGRSVHSIAHRASLAIPLVLVLALLGVAPASAGDGAWTRVGLQGRSLSAIAVSPTNPNVLIAGGQEAAGDTKEAPVDVFRSADRGKTWASVAPAIKFGIIAGWSNTEVGFFEFDPKDPSIVYAYIRSSGFEGDLNKGSGLYRSSDGGKTWRLVYEGDVYNVAISPADPRTVYLAASKGIEPGCYKDPCPTSLPGNGPEIAKSTDRGLTWKHLTGLFWRQQVAVSPTNPEVLIVGGLSLEGPSPEKEPPPRMSADGGRSWVPARSPAGLVSTPAFDRSGSTAFASFVSQGCDTATRAGCRVGVLKSTDGGKAWQAGYGVDNPKAGFGIVSILPDPLNGSVVFAETTNPSSADYFGVLRSTDAGASFAPLGSTVHGLVPKGLALDRANPQTLYAATWDGLWAYTFDKAAAAVVTPTATAIATKTAAPTSTATATPVATPTPVPTATSAATPTSAPSPTGAPTPTAQTIAAAAPTATAVPAAAATATPEATPTPAEGSGFGSSLLIVGAGAAVLLIGGLVGRLLLRRGP